MNKSILVGRLGQDPEVRYTANGKAVATFNLAVTRVPGNQERKEVTDWIPIVCWEKLAEVVGNNLAKGRRILVEGRLQVRSYEAQDGSKRRVAEVIAQNIEFLDSQRKDAAPPPSDQDAPGTNNHADGFGFGPSVPEEDIPF